MVGGCWYGLAKREREEVSNIQIKDDGGLD